MSSPWCARAAVRRRTDDVEQPVGVGTQPQVGGAGAAQSQRDGGPLGGGGRRVARPQLRRRRSAPRAARRSPGRRRQHADVGQLQLARVDDLDREHVVPDARACAAAGAQSAGRRQEVGDHHGQPAPAGRAVEHVDQGAEVGPARLDGGVARSARSRPCASLRPGRRRAAATVCPRAGADHGADPVAAAHGQVGDRRGGRHRQVALEHCAVPKSRLADRSTRARSPARGRRRSAARAARWCAR